MRDFPQVSLHQGDSNVVPLQQFRRGQSLSPLRQAEAYWLALCGPDSLPRRSQIDPRGLANILDHTFILERVAPRVARFRLAGQVLEDLAGMDVRGLPFTALFADGARVEAGSTLERVFSTPNVAELRLSLSRGGGHPMGEGRLLLLPLTTDEGEIARALGVIVADPACRSLPCRFEVSDRLLRATPGAALRPAGPAAPAQSAPEGFAEPRAAYAETGAHLRLVK
ncbi:PAS domain-containing protein [Pseudodonghicola sp.]|uniref:PAS domain-containing protein n=1 Tax=Pseudodonghicola sp. TaxID=1969463 RepID=UPI003A972939